jgi:hypothetical protein
VVVKADSSTLHSAAVAPAPAPGLADDALAASAVIGDTSSGSGVYFRMYTNYGFFIDRSEVRIFEQGRSLQSEPIAVVEVGEDGSAQWLPDAELVSTPMRELSFVLRAYDTEGRFDETAPQALWLVPAGAASTDIAVSLRYHSGAMVPKSDGFQPSWIADTSSSVPGRAADEPGARLS